ncbi:MAG: hypothetical protein SGJ27_18825 [Candidatus Melainabacteria bacterium]|nr:hypothetical protein [Candidatus Melainabacteria bacterium]
MSLRTANQPFRKILFLSLAFLAIQLPAQALDKVISGQVRDHKLKTLRGVKVELWSADNKVALSTHTDGDGKFSLSHESCGPCFLEVSAPRKSGLASALIDKLPGDEGRSVIVTLLRGYPVKGQVMCEGKPLKGIVVKAYSRHHEKNTKERIYGGGAVLSERNGSFQMTLTPGDKKFVLLNNRYPDVSRSSSVTAKVIVDTDLGIVEMTPR